MVTSKKWKIILFCTGYNLIFEFGVKGVAGFSLILLWSILPFIYIAFFAVMVHIATVSSGSEKALLAGAATFGVIPATFLTGFLFYSSNWAGFFMLGFVDFILWWGILQTIFPMYMAAKYFGFDIKNGKLESRDWFIIALFWVILIIFVSISGAAMQGSFEGYFISILLFFLFLLWTRYEIAKSRKPQSIEGFSDSPISSSRLLEIGFWGTIVINLFCGFVITPLYPNPTNFSSNATIAVIIIWSVILGLMIISYKRTNNRSIPLPGLKQLQK